jgi:hypothetical protein
MKPLDLVYRFASAWRLALRQAGRRFIGVLASAMLLGMLCWALALPAA